MEDDRAEAAHSFYEQFVDIPEKSLMDDNSLEETDYESEVEEYTDETIKLEDDDHDGDDFDVEEDYDHYDDDGNDDDNEYQDQVPEQPCKNVPTFNKQFLGNFYNDLGQAMEDTIKSFHHKWGHNVGVTGEKKQAKSIASKTNTAAGGGRCEGFSFPFPLRNEKDRESWNGATIVFQRSASSDNYSVSSRSEDLTFQTGKQSLDHRQSRYTSFGNFIEQAKQNMNKLEQTMSKFERKHSKRFTDVGEACVGVDKDDDDDTATTTAITTATTGVSSKELQSTASSYHEDDDHDKADASMTETNSLRHTHTNTGEGFSPIQSMLEEPIILGAAKDMGDGLLLRTRSDPSLTTERSKTKKVHRTRSYDGCDLVKLAAAIRRQKNCEAEKLAAAKKEMKRKKKIEEVVLGSLELDRYCLSSNSETTASGGVDDRGLQSSEVGNGSDIENILSDIKTVSVTTTELQFRDRRRSAKHFEKMFYDAVEAEKEFHDGYIVTTFNESMSVDHSEDMLPKQNKTLNNSCSQPSEKKRGKKKQVRFLPSPLPRSKKWSERSLSGEIDHLDNLVGRDTGERSMSDSSASEEKHNLSHIIPGKLRRKKVVGTPRGNESTRAAMIQQHFFPGGFKKKGSQIKRRISRGSKTISELVHSKVHLRQTPREATSAECTISFNEDEGSQHGEDMFSDFSHLYSPATIVSPEEDCIEVSASIDQPQENNSDPQTYLETETYERETLLSPFSSMMPMSASDLISPKLAQVGSNGKHIGCRSKIRTVVAAVAFEFDLSETSDEAGLPMMHCTKQEAETDLIPEMSAGRGESDCLPVKTKVFINMQSTRASDIPIRNAATIEPTGWKKLRQRTGNFFGRDGTKRTISKGNSVTFEGSNPIRSDSGCLVEEHGVIESNSDDPGYGMTVSNTSMPFALSDSMKKLSMMRVISAMNEELRIMNERDSRQVL